MQEHRFKLTRRRNRQAHGRLPLISDHDTSNQTYHPPKHMPLCITCQILEVLCTIGASLVMHAPGIYCQARFNGFQLDIMINATVGAIVEGTFILLILNSSIQKYKKCFDRLKDNKEIFCDTGTSSNVLAVFASITIFFLLFFLFGFCLLGDYVFQDKTGGDIPDMMMISAGLIEGTSTVKGTFNQNKKESITYIFITSTCLGLSLAIHQQAALAFKWCPCQNRFLKWHNAKMWVSGITTVMVYAAGAWCPVIHVFISIIGIHLFPPKKFDIKIIKTKALSQTALAEMRIGQFNTTTRKPNVIFLMHDTLSGMDLLKTKEGVLAAPFFHSLLADNDMYLFNHSRSVSGETRENMLAFYSGCLPITRKGLNIAFTRSIGTEFKIQGYQTASFSSHFTRGLEITPWFMLKTYFLSNIDFLASPSTTGHPTIDGFAMDDRLLLPYFHDWLKNDVNTSFFAQFYTHNTHWPYVRDEKSAFPPDQRIFSSIETWDETLKQIFEILDQTGHLENTIIIGASDHGDGKEDEKFTRMHELSPETLSTVTYMYMPKKFFSSHEEELTLKNNTKQVVSALDIFPTLQHILYNGSSTMTSNLRKKVSAANTQDAVEMKHCITGFDLLKSPIPENTVTFSFNTLKRFDGPVAKRDTLKYIGALSNVERGFYVNDRNEAFELNFSSCTKEGSQCKHRMELKKGEEKLYWENVIQTLQSSSHVSSNLLTSFWIKKFHKALREEGSRVQKNFQADFFLNRQQ